jgi:hypothetical protein
LVLTFLLAALAVSAFVPPGLGFVMRGTRSIRRSLASW